MNKVGNIDYGISRRNPKGKWTPFHKGVFAFATCIAVVGLFALAAQKVMADDQKGVTTHIEGSCGVLVAHIWDNRQPTFQPQVWDIKSEDGTVYASGNVHTSMLFIPPGFYYFRSEDFTQVGQVGTSGCDGKTIIHNFIRMVL